MFCVHGFNIYIAAPVYTPTGMQERSGCAAFSPLLGIVSLSDVSSSSECV